MGTMKLIGILAIIPTAGLLALSFFVLFAVRKVETQGLKAFGYVIAVLLWISAALVFSAGVYTISTGQHPMMTMMQQMMKGPMQGQMQGPMMRGQMQEEMRRR